VENLSLDAGDFRLVAFDRAMTDILMGPGMLKLRLLGELEVWRGEELLQLPPSRKTRALLAYLVCTGKPQRRERLCSVFWDIPDDPRGALRWSMSRLRAIVDDEDHTRLVANREVAGFEADCAEVDYWRLRKIVADGIENLPADSLGEAAGLFSGEFLEGLDLPNQHDFQAWCVAEREELRRIQIAIFDRLIELNASDPEVALQWSRQLVQVDPFNEEARAALLSRLFSSGRRQEAESHFETARRLYRELGLESQQRLERVWHDIQRQNIQKPAVDNPATVAAAVSPHVEAPSVPVREFVATQLVGREEQLRVLHELFERSIANAEVRVVEILGETGIGKTRLVQEFASQIQSKGIKTLAGRSYDFRIGAAYGPWVEAVGELPTLETSQSASQGREKLFAALSQRISGDGSQPVFIAFDDIHWCDEASADLLHHIVHNLRNFPLMIALIAREGELQDNVPLSSVLHSFHHDGLIETIHVEPLSPEQTGKIVGATVSSAEVMQIAKLSGGNPLYATELARGIASVSSALPGSLKDLVRQRVEKLPPAASDLLRWASVAGPLVDVETLRLACGGEPDDIIDLLEIVERHNILKPVESESYTFSHELVRQAIYTGLSEPRRRLMHLKLARLLNEHSAERKIPALDIAYHAAAGGDAIMAADACIAAGRRCVRLFAHADAMALVRQGRHYAELLDEPARTKRLIKVTEIECNVSRPEDLAALTASIEQYAETALDYGRSELARRCYTLLANIRWEEGAWTDAERETLRSELVSRATDDRERVVALAEASRCLAMLERDLGTAEKLVLEADALANRLGIEHNAIPDALGMLRSYKGVHDEAAELFDRAKLIARRDGDRVSEFIALEHLVTLRMESGPGPDTDRLCAQTVELAEKLRSGSELPFANALSAFCQLLHGDDNTLEKFEEALAALRNVDAKHRLCLVASAAAGVLIERRNWARAKKFAEEALAAASAIDRNSDIVVALSMLVRIAAAMGDEDRRREHADRLVEKLSRGVSSYAGRMAESALAIDFVMPAETGG
jgi:predicted ATPase/DNA-binding SARP family transcriptional activator